MKIGVIGRGKIGRVLIQRDCFPLDCDILKPNTVERVVAREKPDVIVNLASHSNPDWCESNFDDALNLNCYAFSELCVLTERRKIVLVTLSTDHIFSGKTFFDWKTKRLIRSGPYKEDYPRAIPVNNYGITKLGMEAIAAAFSNTRVVRTSYCFDYERLVWHIDGLKKGYSADFPTFIERSFLHTEHFVDSFMEYLHRVLEMPKILHISGNKAVSWYSFMRMVADKFGLDVSLVVPRKRDTGDYVPRPYRAGLDVSRSRELGLPQNDYKTGIDYMAENCK